MYIFQRQIFFQILRENFNFSTFLSQIVYIALTFSLILQIWIFFSLYSCFICLFPSILEEVAFFVLCELSLGVDGIFSLNLFFCLMSKHSLAG